MMNTRSQTVNLAAQVDFVAKGAFLLFCADLRAHQQYLYDFEVAEKLCGALANDKVRQAMMAGMKKEYTQKSGHTVAFSVRVSKEAKGAFEGFAADVKCACPEVRRDYQVVQGMLFLLQVPDVQTLLWPRMNRWRGQCLKPADPEKIHRSGAFRP
jgi:hypothetical protein